MATFLIAIVVIGGAAIILLFVNRSIVSNRDESSDAIKMRSIFRAIDLYESANNGYPPLDLTATTLQTDDLTTFVSSDDPFTVGENFPLDPAFPDSKKRSKFRISFTYLPQWIANGKVKPTDAQALYMDATAGILACYWYGNTGHLRPDGLDSSGPIVQIAMDGSARVIPVKTRQLLDASELFSLPKKMTR